MSSVTLTATAKTDEAINPKALFYNALTYAVYSPIGVLWDNEARALLAEKFPNAKTLAPAIGLDESLTTQFLTQIDLIKAADLTFKEKLESRKAKENAGQELSTWNVGITDKQDRLARANILQLQKNLGAACTQELGS